MDRQFRLDCNVIPRSVLGRNISLRWLTSNFAYIFCRMPKSQEQSGGSSQQTLEGEDDRDRTQRGRCGTVDSMWVTVATCILKVAMKVLGCWKVRNTSLRTRGGGMDTSKRLSRRRSATRVGIMIEAQATWISTKKPRRKQGDL